MKTLELINKIQASNTIEEKEINLLKNRSNKGEVIELNFMYNNEIELTKEHTAKGLKFLKSQLYTPTGKERTNHFFGHREVYVIDNFDCFNFNGFYDASTYGGMKNLVPIYIAFGLDGTNFEYYYFNGKISIIG